MMDEKEWYRKNINFKNQVIVDIGGNVGNLSEFFWQQSQGSSRLVVIEPVPENLEKIRERAARLNAHWEIHPIALSNHSGEISFMTNSQKFQWGVNGQVAESQNTDYPTDPADTTYKCDKLSNIAPDATIVKMDIEGHEYVILPTCLCEMKHVHTWAIELHRRKEYPLEKTLQDFTRYGYSLQTLTQGPISDSLTWEDIPKHFYKLPSGEERWLKKINLLAQKP